MKNKKQKLYTKVNGLRFRKSPDTKNLQNLIRKLNKGQELEFLDGPWLKVRIGRTEGWVHGDYVIEDVPAIKKQPKNTAKRTKLKTDFIWPLFETHQQILQSFGVLWVCNKRKKHVGVDVSAPLGAEVFAVANGIIVRIGNAGKQWAQYVDIKHDSGDFCTSYIHITPKMKKGDMVKAGDVIGFVAEIRGLSHLHFNVWKGAYGNPITHRGALPPINNVGKVEPKSDPPFPSNFIDPKFLTYIYKDRKNKSAS